MSRVLSVFMSLAHFNNLREHLGFINSVNLSDGHYILIFDQPI